MGDDDERVDVEALRAYLTDYLGSAAFGTGMHFLLLEVSEVQRMTAPELCRKARDLGIDPRRFER